METDARFSAVNWRQYYFSGPAGFLEFPLFGRDTVASELVPSVIAQFFLCAEGVPDDLGALPSRFNQRSVFHVCCPCPLFA